jgi:hypothetical protein
MHETEERLAAFHFDCVRPAVVRTAMRSASSMASTTNLRSADPLTAAEMKSSAVWLALTFKMWAWLVLHEFNPLDRVIERSKYQNSRLAVYIS